MFGMSVNEVPGWSVAMAPRLMGVPVALTPGLVPHCEVLVVPVPVLLDDDPDGDAALDVEPPDAVLELLELELHPASTPPTARTEASAAASRHRR
jgi:hypothetical protein